MDKEELLRFFKYMDDEEKVYLAQYSWCWNGEDETSELMTTDPSYHIDGWLERYAKHCAKAEGKE